MKRYVYILILLASTLLMRCDSKKQVPRELNGDGNRYCSVDIFTLSGVACSNGVEHEDAKVNFDKRNGEITISFFGSNEADTVRITKNAGGQYHSIKTFNEEDGVVLVSVETFYLDSVVCKVIKQQDIHDAVNIRYDVINYYPNGFKKYSLRKGIKFTLEHLLKQDYLRRNSNSYAEALCTIENGRFIANEKITTEGSEMSPVTRLRILLPQQFGISDRNLQSVKDGIFWYFFMNEYQR
jgi:hypothetical protein